ncbi:hypothetical protein PHJA_002561300 [Phtheirospermum japonicum]|uniref:Uncharacterized protein n=1 Tax=Phtheirospermum japonicum TaxID=374723 RepID=A0A830D7F9_9LAMI|nr:hypothetical protein PHJA_002561300 [Phtheirospermum japonicum]
MRAGVRSCFIPHHQIAGLLMCINVSRVPSSLDLAFVNPNELFQAHLSLPAHVNFSFCVIAVQTFQEANKRNILDGVSFVVPAGESMAIVEVLSGGEKQRVELARKAPLVFNTVYAFAAAK